MKTRRAVSLVEVLVVIAIVTVIGALAVPALRNSREAASQTRYLSSVRQIAGAVMVYSAESQDRAPTLIPNPGWPEEHLTEVVIDGAAIQSHWFGNRGMYKYLLDPYLPNDVLQGPFPKEAYYQHTNRGKVLVTTSFELTETLYAAPNYWVYQSQTPAGWGTQQMSTVALPAQKGFVHQNPFIEVRIPDEPGKPLIYPPDFQTKYMTTKRPVAWFDLSASSVNNKELLPGTINRFYFQSDPGSYGPWNANNGIPIAHTSWGLLGMDRR